MHLTPWQNRWLGAAAALLAVVVAAVVWPHTPVHASATDRYDNFAICTGVCDEGDLEGLFILDFATCQLKACVVLPQTNHFAAPYVRDIRADMGVDPSMSPKFLMVTGSHRILANKDFPRGCKSLLYVAELNSGRVVAYAVGKVNNGPNYISPLATTQFRDANTVRGGLLQGGAVTLPKE